MGFWSLLLVASTPAVQVLLVGLLGAYLASGYSNILLPGARRDMNKVNRSQPKSNQVLYIFVAFIMDLNRELPFQQVVFAVFTPALMFANLAKTVTFQEIISCNTLSFDRCSDGTVPCITLILGGNLTQGKKSLSFCNLHAHESIIHLKASETCAGLRKSVIRPVLIVAIVCVRYVILPAFGIAVVKAAYGLGFVPYDPLYRYVLMVQFGLPPAMSIGKKAPSLFSSTCFVERKGFQGDEHNCAGTMAQLFDVGQEECSVIFLWTYLIAAVSLTVWSTIFMWILS
ncbi:hypothetical protein B296_00005664 [Ensete ventricosum]|uniref:Uncharacterized protein n=1 Tax=Ensete ventricosum TaxID=4639 RepID=A0A426ZZ35_ENSVE|nr:hypothetical protein B296_00005664 [Ensete ventricosum]